MLVQFCFKQLKIHGCQGICSYLLNRVCYIYQISFINCGRCTLSWSCSCKVNQYHRSHCEMPNKYNLLIFRNISYLRAGFGMTGFVVKLLFRPCGFGSLCFGCGLVCASSNSSSCASSNSSSSASSANSSSAKQGNRYKT